MLNLQGIDMLIDASGEAEEFIKKYMPMSLYYPWRRPSFPGFGTMGTSYPTQMYAEPEFKLNRLHWPCKYISRWAFIHMLAASDGVGLLLPYACSGGNYFPLTLTIGNPETGGETVILPNMYLLPPTPLSGIRGLTGPTNSLYLLTVVDVRFFLWFMDSGDLTTFMTTSTTWTNLFKYLVQQVNKVFPSVIVNVDPIPSTYLQPSIQHYNLPYEPLPILLDDVAFNVGQRITSNYDGSFYSQNFASAYAAFQADVASNPQRNILSGGFRYSSPL